MKFAGKVDKAYEEQTASQLQYAPVSALKGVSNNDAIALKKAFGLVTIRDLAELKYAEWANDLCALAKNSPSSGLDDFRLNLDKKYEKKKAGQIPGSPVDALQGVSKADATLLKKAFNIKTVQDLAKLKYIAWAKEISEAAQSSILQTPEAEKEKSNWFKFVWLLLSLLALLLVFYLFYAGKCSLPFKSKPSTGANTTAIKDKKPPATEKPAPIKDQGNLRSATEYTIVPGDTLVGISEKVYGTFKNSGKLFQANRKRIRKPGEIFPGTKLVVPRE